MTPRRGVPADAEALAGLEQELFGVEAYGAGSVRDELVDARRVVLVVGDPAVGYVVLALAGEVADVERIGVSATHRRQGHAGRLLGAADAQARVRGAVRLLLEVGADNAEALAFYAAEGFEAIAHRRGYYRDGTDVLVLERALRA